MEKTKKQDLGIKERINIGMDTKDMKKGLITKVTATPANVADKVGIEILRPERKIVYMDKGYDYKDTDELLKRLGSEPATIRKKNSKKKDKKASGYRCKIRMPYESTFSKCRKRTRYVGLDKTIMQVTLESIAHNLKKGIKYAVI